MSMRFLAILISISSLSNLLCQQNLVNTFGYEIRRDFPLEIPSTQNKLTIHQRDTETYEFLEDPYDKNYTPKSRFRITVQKPYGAFYYNRADNSAVWLRMLSKKDTVRAEITFEPKAWTLLPDTATIEGFFCKKAHRIINDEGWSVTAWYTEDLGPNIHAMPKPYLGLPGVLVKSNQFPVMRLRAVRLAEEGPEVLRPSGGKLKSLKRLISAKSKAQNLMDIMPE